MLAEDRLHAALRIVFSVLILLTCQTKIDFYEIETEETFRLLVQAGRRGDSDCDKRKSLR